MKRLSYKAKEKKWDSFRTAVIDWENEKYLRVF